MGEGDLDVRITDRRRGEETGTKAALEAKCWGVHKYRSPKVRKGIKEGTLVRANKKVQVLMASS